MVLPELDGLVSGVGDGGAGCAAGGRGDVDAVAGVGVGGVPFLDAVAVTGEVACRAELGFASKIHPFAVTRSRCLEAIALADRHDWAADPIVAPALITLTANLAWTAALDEGERWLRRAERALQTDAGPDIRQLLHLANEILQAGDAYDATRRRPLHEWSNRSRAVGGPRRIGPRPNGRRRQSDSASDW